MKKILSIALGFIISFVFLAIVIKQMDFAKVAQSFKSVKLWHITLIVLITSCDLTLRGLKWRLLLQPSRNIGWFKVTKLATIGLALNNVLPFRLGEVARSVLCSGKHKIPLITVLSTIIVERMVDLLSLAIIFLLATYLMPVSSVIAEIKPLALILVVCLITGFTMLVSADNLIKKFPRINVLLEEYPKIGKLVKEIIIGAKAFKNPKKALLIILYGIGLWTVSAMSYLVAGFAFGFQPALTYGKALIAVCTTAIAASIPSMPGYFGTFELAIQKLLSLWGYDPNLSLAYAAFVHISVYLVMTLFGLIFLYQTGTSIAQVWNNFAAKAQKAEEDVK